MKLPPKAKRVFTGVIFDVYHWQQEMFNGSVETFEMLKRTPTVEIIATQKDKVFLTHQSQPTKPDFYSLLGGRAEEHETPLEAAKRELMEESGLESNDWELLNMYEPVHKIDWQVYLFVARDCKKTASQKLDPGEKIEVVSYTFEEFLRLVKSKKYWGIEFMLDVYRMQEEPHQLEMFKKKLF